VFIEANPKRLHKLKASN